MTANSRSRSLSSPSSTPTFGVSLRPMPPSTRRCTRAGLPDSLMVVDFDRAMALRSRPRKGWARQYVSQGNYCRVCGRCFGVYRSRRKRVSLVRQVPNRFPRGRPQNRRLTRLDRLRRGHRASATTARRTMAFLLAPNPRTLRGQTIQRHGLISRSSCRPNGRPAKAKLRNGGSRRPMKSVKLLRIMTPGGSSRSPTHWRKRIGSRISLIISSLPKIRRGVWTSSLTQPKNRGGGASAMTTITSLNRAHKMRTCRERSSTLR